jgi:hypothetical protein
MIEKLEATNEACKCMAISSGEISLMLVSKTEENQLIIKLSREKSIPRIKRLSLAKLRSIFELPVFVTPFIPRANSYIVRKQKNPTGGGMQKFHMSF